MVSMAARPGGDDSLGLEVGALAAAVSATGAEVEVLSRATSLPAMTRIGADVVGHELSAGPAGVLRGDDLVAHTDAFGEAIAQLARGSVYDLLHAHGWTSGLAALPVALELGLPLVQSFHGLGVQRPPASEHRIRTEMFLANQASAIVTGSAADIPTLIDQVRAPADRIWVIPPGVDLDLFRPERSRTADDIVRARFGIDHDRPIIAVVGPVSATDMMLAIRSLSALHSLRGWAPVLVVVADGERADVEALHDLAAEIGVDGDVRFAFEMTRSQLADLLSVATVAVIPSASAPLGAAGLESAASGTPVVGFRGAGLVESEGASAVLVDSRDPREWAHTITQLLDDQVALDALSASARRHAEGYSWASSAAAMTAVYASLT